MEFKSRAVDERPPSPIHFTPSSSINSFNELALRASDSIPITRQNSELMRDAMLQREIEKERIREEIIAEEIFRRRALEAEVRRELMMEQQMVLRGQGGGGMSLGGRLTMRVPLVNQFDYRFLEERLSLPSHGRSMHDFFPQLLLPRGPLVAPDVKPAPQDNKDKLIALAKPDPSLCGAKRKAATTPEGGAGELPFTRLKKPKEDWSCALCQVSATSERGLNEHLQGRKHRAKEAGLLAEKMTKNTCTASLMKKTAKQSKLTANGAGFELEAKVEGELSQVNESGDDSKKGTKEKGEEGSKNELPTKSNKDDRNLNKTGMTALHWEDRTEEFRKQKKFKFWCEICRIGAYFEVVMETHRKGKKHLARLQKLSQDGEIAPAIFTLGSSESTEKLKHSEVGIEEPNKNTGEIVRGDEETEIATGNGKTYDEDN